MNEFFRNAACRHVVSGTKNDDAGLGLGSTHRGTRRALATDSLRPIKAQCEVKSDTELVLIRGLPGSGKSTMARILRQVGYEHFEADIFFEDRGVYRYDASRVADAHAWCQRDTKISKLTFELAQLRRLKFDRTSERMSAEQRLLFDEAVDADIAAIDASYTNVMTPASPRRCHGNPSTSASSCSRASDCGAPLPPPGQTKRPWYNRRAASQMPIPSCTAP